MHPAGTCQRPAASRCRNNSGHRNHQNPRKPQRQVFTRKHRSCKPKSHHQVTSTITATLRMCPAMVEPSLRMGSDYQIETSRQGQRSRFPPVREYLSRNGSPCRVRGASTKVADSPESTRTRETVATLFVFFYGNRSAIPRGVVGQIPIDLATSQYRQLGPEPSSSAASERQPGAPCTTPGSTSMKRTNDETMDP
jgi:hypothetical protein